MTAAHFLSDAEWILYTTKSVESSRRFTLRHQPTVVADAYFAVQATHLVGVMRSQHSRRYPWRHVADWRIPKHVTQFEPVKFELTGEDCRKFVLQRIKDQGSLFEDAQQSGMLTAIGLAANWCEDTYKSRPSGKDVFSQSVMRLFGRGPTAQSLIGCYHSATAGAAGSLDLDKLCDAAQGPLLQRNSKVGPDAVTMGIRGQFQSIAAALSSAQSMADQMSLGPNSRSIKNIVRKISFKLRQHENVHGKEWRIDTMQEDLRRIGEQSATARSLGATLAPLLSRAKAQFLLTVGHTGFTTSRVRKEHKIDDLVSVLSRRKGVVSRIKAEYSKIMQTSRLFDDFDHSDARLFVQAFMRYLWSYAKKYIVMGTSMVAADALTWPALQQELNQMRREEASLKKRIQRIQQRLKMLYASRVEELPRQQQQRMIQYLREARRTMGSDNNVPAMRYMLDMVEGKYREWTTAGKNHRLVVMATAENLVRCIFACGSKQARIRTLQAFGPVLRPLLMFCQPNQTKQRVASLTDRDGSLAKVNSVNEYCNIVQTYNRAFC